MNNDINIHNFAYEKAKKELEKHFDPEAYIVMVLSEKNIDIPNTKIDNNINNLNNQFLNYLNIKEKYKNNEINKEELLNYLNQFMCLISKIILELYHSCSCVEEKETIKTEYAKINSNF